MHPERPARLARCALGLGLALCLDAGAVGRSGGAAAAAAAEGVAALESGRRVFEAACATCHGRDGSGAPGRAAYGVELPNFRDCRFVSGETDLDFFAVAHAGGPVRGLSAVMPGFGAVLDEDQLRGALAWVRTFCAEPEWPRGELNLPRALVTEKAYPEDEAVVTTRVALDDGDAVLFDLLYERRVGRLDQFEIEIPVGAREDPQRAGDWNGGLGDVALGWKRVLLHSLPRGSILSLGGELVLPTGDRGAGLGRGAVVLEPYLAFGQLLPADAFFQAQVLGEIPTEGSAGDPELVLRAALGTSVAPQRFGRTWSPQVEVLMAERFGDGRSDLHWDVVPQLQVTLNERQHVMLDVGVRVPLSQRGRRPTELQVYLLWDWFDGGLFEGW